MIKKLYSKNNSIEDIQEIVNLLNDGGVAILPTDTMYAICCNALKERAIERICKIKNIDLKKKSLSIIFKDMSQVSEYAKMDNDAFKLMKRNLPGPFTFILPARNKLPKIFKNRKEMGVHLPNHPVMREIFGIMEDPIMKTTIPYDSDDEIEYLTNPELIDERLGHAVDLVVDGGDGGTEPSTIVYCVDGSNEVIRQGKGELI